MGDTLPKFTAAAVQAAPIFLDREATIDKACALIDEAARAGAQLIVFPETWVPGYPFWHTTPQLFAGKLYAELWKNAVEVPSEATQRIAAAARSAASYVVIGLNERDTSGRGTLYNTLLYFAPDGSIVRRHRKLVPTFTERTVWGFGDGSDLELVHTPLGRIGGLICWEHEMSLAKYALYAQGEQVHCAVWPAYSMQNDHIDFGMRQCAFEGACFVVSACGVVVPNQYPKALGEPPKANGGSAIISPRGVYLAGPVYDAEEILYAELDLEDAIREKHSRDVAGHYARPDVFQLVINRRPKPVARFTEARTTVVAGEDAIDRLEAVREYLGSLRQSTDGDSELSKALSEALASIDMAAAGMWSRE